MGRDARTVVLHAAVHAWMEGHLEGHDCAGDEDEPGDPNVRRALRDGRSVMRPEDAARAARQMGISTDHFLKLYEVELVD